MKNSSPTAQASIWRQQLPYRLKEGALIALGAVIRGETYHFEIVSNEMAAGMVSEIGGSGDTLNRLHEMVEEERTQAAGRARMARDAMDMSEVNLKEAEMDALADQALAEFAAKEGIALPGQPASAAPATERSMGGSAPQSENQ